jgi:Ferredoxin-like domain in Api92-like protein
MPNTCQCTLEITGDPEEVRACLTAMSSPESAVDDERLFDFDRVVPLPAEFRERLKEPSATTSDWLDKAGQMLGYWGTKWNAYDVTVERQPEGRWARIKFNTAWTPPIPVITTLADQFPNLAFDLAYFDVMAAYAGRGRRAPGDTQWATIEGTYDYGFCDAAFEARSGGSWEQDPNAGSLVGDPGNADPTQLSTDSEE